MYFHTRNTRHISIQREKRTVRDGDNVGGLIDTTLKLSFVTARVGVWVHRIKTFWKDTVSSLTKCTEGTVRAVKCIVKGVPETPNGCVCGSLVDLIELVVGLEKDSPLRPNEWLRGFKVQIGLNSSGSHVLGSPESSVDVLFNGVRSIRDFGIQRAPESIEILLCIMVVCKNQSEILTRTVSI